jgi:serine/threonine-protein kinase PknK
VRTHAPDLVIVDIRMPPTHTEGRSSTGIARQLWVTKGTMENRVHSILTKPALPETDDDHRRVLAVVTFLEAR